LWRKQN